MISYDDAFGDGIGYGYANGNGGSGAVSRSIEDMLQKDLKAPMENPNSWLIGGSGQGKRTWVIATSDDLREIVANTLVRKP